MTDYCYHSGMVDDCIGCQKGLVHLQEAHIDRLRKMLIDAGAVEALREHDAYWFGGNALPLPEPSAVLARSKPVVQEPYTPAVTLAEPIYNEQGFSVGFRVTHPPGVSCVFDPATSRCSCGKLDLGVVSDDQISTEQSPSPS